MRRLAIKPTAVWSVVKEIKAATEDFRPLLLAGAPETVGRLSEALTAGGGHEDAFRDLSGWQPRPYDLEGADVLVYAIEGTAPSKEDEEVLRLADRKDVEIVCILVGEPESEVVNVPHVLATDVVSVARGEELPLERIAERIAERAGDKSYTLAAKLPSLRRAVCEEIVRGFSRQNGILGAAIFIPGADLPVLTLNQIRMVLRIAAAHGEEIDRERALELLPIVAAGFGFRALARQIAGLVPGAGWAVKGGIAFAGTRAVGEAAIAYFQGEVPRKLKGSVESVRTRS
ncbi:MAG: YcjF family protein [Gaiellaceae bacterium]